MLSRNKIMIALGLLVIASMVLAACQPAATTGTPIVQTVVVTQIVEGTPKEVVQVVTPTPAPTEAVSRTLVICEGQEPDTLYIYGGSAMLASSQVQQAIYDGPIDSNSYAFQPVILEKLPSLADGDATLNPVTVKEGDKVTDATTNVITLDPAADPPQQIILSGATDPVTYTGGEVQMDQLAVTFKLVPGLMWSDGTPLKASDSVYSFKLAADPDSKGQKFLPDHTASYEAPDDATVVWTGLPGYKDQTYFTNIYQPLPEFAWSQFTAVELETEQSSSRTPIGWGPYIIDNWTAGDNITLHKNPNYFRASEGLPKFDNLVFRFIGEDSNAAIAALLAGECDVVDQTIGLDNQSELLLSLQAAGQINPTFVTGTTWEHVDFGIQNISYDDGYDGGVKDRPDFFSDLRTRQAFIMCMDRQSVVDTVTFGQSIVIDDYIPPQHPLFNSEVKHFDFSVEQATALLDEVGWKDDDADPSTPRVASGVAGVPDGTKLQVTYTSTTAALRTQVMQIIQQSLAQCGIQADINQIPASEWFADGPDGPLYGRRFDLGEFAWLTGVTPPCELYRSSDTSGPLDGSWIPVMAPDAGPQKFKQGWGGQNDVGFYNPDYDAACNQAVTSLPGQPTYESAHKEAQKLFSEGLPVAPLFLRLKLAATRPDMCNFIMDPTNNSEMWNIEEFDYGAGCTSQ